MGEIKIDGYICERCSHKWISRRPNKPICCARCKSPYWNVPRKGRGLRGNAVSLKRGGR